MKTTIELDSAIEMKLSDALMIYTQDNRAAYVTQHKVHNGQLGPAKPLTDDFLTKLSEELERRMKVEILPEKVLVRTPKTIVWWTPLRRRIMYFTTSEGDEPTADLNGRLYPQPPLIWMVTNDSLTIRALKDCFTRPTESTKLYRAPYWNVDEKGRVCLGSMETPDTTTARTIDQWENGFFASKFTHPNASKLVEYPRPYIEFLRDVVCDEDGAGSFPVEYLVDAHETLEQFIQRGGR